MNRCRANVLYFWLWFLSVAVVCAPVAVATPASYFDMREKRFDNVTPFPKWMGMVSRFEAEEKTPDSECGKSRFTPCSAQEWSTLLDSLADKPFKEQLEAVNTWSNSHPYIEDIVNWGVDDYWETPFEFIEVYGDCEDYAISKYYSLRALGVAADKMRIIIVQDLNLGGVIHAVLGIYNGGELLILDNQSVYVMPALKIYHYRPIFGINEDAWWAYYPKQG